MAKFLIIRDAVGHRSLNSFVNNKVCCLVTGVRTHFSSRLIVPIAWPPNFSFYNSFPSGLPHLLLNWVILRSIFNSKGLSRIRGLTCWSEWFSKQNQIEASIFIFFCEFLASNLVWLAWICCSTEMNADSLIWAISFWRFGHDEWGVRRIRTAILRAFGEPFKKVHFG